MTECTMCGCEETKGHVCTDGAIYQHHSRMKDPKAFDDMLDEIMHRALLRSVELEEDIT